MDGCRFSRLGACGDGGGEGGRYQPAARESLGLSMRGVSRHGLSDGGEEGWRCVV